MSFQTSFVDPPCVSHKWSGVLGHSDGVSSPECCADNVSHLLSHGIPGGVQSVQSQTASVTSKSAFLSPIHIMTNSVVNSVTSVGGILVPCANRLYGLVLTLQTYHPHYKSRILQSGCFFDQISRSIPKPAINVS